MTFPGSWFLSFLNRMGWPQTKGLFIRKQVISSIVLWGGLVTLVRGGIALGALRPKTAISLLADLLTKRDWNQQSATELWTALDTSKQVTNNSDKSPEEVITEIQSPMVFFKNKSEKFDNILKDVIEWKYIFTEKFSVYFHWIFAQGLAWGLSHSEEALAYYEEQRQTHLKNLPDMLSNGLDVHSPETFEEFADAMEESVNAFQDEIRPLAKVPQELLSLPAIATRLNSM